MRLERALSMTQICKSIMDVRSDHAEKKAYETGFEECRALAIQMLSLDKAHLL